MSSQLLPRSVFGLEKYTCSGTGKVVNMFLRLSMLTMLAVAIISEGVIWESQTPWRKYYMRFQVVPSKIVTAKKLAKYFLVQEEASDWFGIKGSAKRLKRQAGRRPMSIPYDVLFMIDSSGSIPKKSFRNGLKALMGLLPKNRPDTIYSCLSFSNDVYLDFPFSSAKDAKRALEKVTYRRGKTNTQAALDMARVKVFNISSNIGARVKAFKRALILTDGQSNIHKVRTLYNAFLLKESGVEVFVIAVGKYLEGISEIVGLASSTDAHLYRVRSFEDLLKVIKIIPNWRKLREQQNRLWLDSMSIKDNEY